MLIIMFLKKKKKFIMFIMSEGHYCLVNLNLSIKLRTGLSVKWHVVVSVATVGAGGAVVAVTLSLCFSLLFVVYWRSFTAFVGVLLTLARGPTLFCWILM